MIRHLPPPPPEHAARGYIAGLEIESDCGDVLRLDYSPPVTGRPNGSPDLPATITLTVEGTDDFGEPADAGTELDATRTSALIAWLTAALAHMTKP